MITDDQLPDLPKHDTHCFDEDDNRDVWSHSDEQVRTIQREAYKAGMLAAAAMVLDAPKDWILASCEAQDMANVIIAATRGE